jgi:hypothetical protein
MYITNRLLYLMVSTMMRSVMIFDRPFLGRYAFQIIFAFWLLGGQLAFARSCVVNGPRYNLIDDTVDWSIRIASGGSCVRGLRFGTVILENVKLVSPPQSGQVELLGSAFTYTAKADFNGQDAFSLAVFGVINQISGRSTINVNVSVVQANPSIVPQR